MSRINSGFIMPDKTQIFYEILDDGFDIYIGENAAHPLYHQPEPYIPNPDLSYEENAINMCKDISSPSQFEGSALDKRLMNLESNVDYLMLLNDSVEE